MADQLVEATVVKPEDFTDTSVFEQTEAETPNTEEETGDYNQDAIDADDADDSAPEQPQS